MMKTEKQNTFISKGEPINLCGVKITSDRIALLPISEKYAQYIFEEFTPEITRYMFPSPPEKIEEIKEFINSCRVGIERGDDLTFVIVENNEEGTFLGCCGLHGHKKIKTPELGIWIKKGSHGCGYGREAITILKDWVEQTLDCDYLVYPVAVKNLSSRKIAEILGGEVHEQKMTTNQNGDSMEEVVYRISV